MLPRPNSKAVNRRERLGLPETETPRRPAKERVADFEEPWAPVTLEWAKTAALRCIQCPSVPCVKACPVENDIPYALWQLEHGRIEDAARVFRATNAMPSICGRICPQTELCEGACVYGKQDRAPVPIGRLEAWVSDWAEERGLGLAAAPARPSGRRVAIVGAGPAGITAAEQLALMGHAVTLFDAWPEAGGLLLYGIPRFKLAPEIVRERVRRLGGLGIRRSFGTRIDEETGVEDLIDRGFDAVLLAIGAGVGRPIDIEGAELDEVYQATPFLVGANVDPGLLPPGLEPLTRIGRRVAVIGGGDTAMDCVRTALRLGASEATVWYRRTESEMPGNPRDRLLAVQEGARMEWLTAPVALLSDGSGRVRAMRLSRMRLGHPDESGRRRPTPIPGSEFEVSVDTVVLALGYLPDARFVAGIEDLAVESDGRIVVDPDTGATNRPGIFAAGDDVLGPALVVDAVAHGIRASESIHAFLAAGGSAASR
jgi:glutamate synthase (NADPH/NADH) small chain